MIAVISHNDIPDFESDLLGDGFGNSTLLRVSSFEMTIDQFRNDPQLPGMWAKEMTGNPLLQTVLSVMDEAHPARFAIHGDNNEDVSPTRAAIELGLTRGYSKYGDTLKLLAIRKTKPEDIGAPTYEEPPKEEPQNVRG